jgi:hypothetical protein
MLAILISTIDSFLILGFINLVINPTISFDFNNNAPRAVIVASKEVSS